MATQVSSGLIENNAINDAHIANVALTGVTASSGDSSTALATTAFVATEINSLIDSAPGALNTLNELAAAMGDDANFSTTVTNNIALKLNLTGGTLTGGLGISYTNPILSLTTPWSTGNYGQIRLGYTAGTERSITGHYDNGLEFKVNTNTMSYNTSGALTVPSTITSNSGMVEAGSSSPTQLQKSGSHGYINMPDSGNMYFRIGSSFDTALTIKSNSNVGIGTSDPLALLSIKGTGDAIRVESTNTGVGGAQVDLLHFTTSPADNDIHGTINFGGYTSGTSSAYGSSIRSVWSDVGAKEAQLEFFTRDDSDFAARMIIDKDGNVGFGGQQAPGTPIHVGTSTSTGPRIQISHENSGGFGALDIDAYGSATFRLLSNWTGSVMNGLPVQSFGLLTPHAYDIHIGTAGASRLRVKANGKVAVGDINPYAQLTVYRSGSDSYSPTSFLDQPTMELKGDNVNGGYIGTRITNTSGNYEWFYGVNQDGSNTADFVIQGFDRPSTAYREFARMHDIGAWSVPKQPHWFGSATNTSGSGLANAQTPHSSHSRNTINITTVSGALRWIIPRTGVYVISFNTIADSGSARVDTNIKINGTNISNTLSPSHANASNQYRQRSATIIVYVQENDYIQFQHDDWYNSNSNVFDNWRTISLTMVS